MAVQIFLRLRPMNTFKTMVLGKTVFTALAVESTRDCTCSVKESGTYFGTTMISGAATVCNGFEVTGSKKIFKSLS